MATHTMKMQQCILILLSIIFSISLFAQDPRLAQQYFQDGEYEKAAIVYEQLFEKDPRNDYYFDRYISCLTVAGDFANAEKAVKKQLRETPQEAKLYVTYGNILDLQFQPQAAQKQYEEAIKKISAERFSIHKVASAFLEINKYDFAIATYQRGGKLINSPYEFSYNLAELYRRKGDASNMIEQYLNTIYDKPERLNTVKQLLQRYLEEKDYEILKKQLYARIQDYPDYFFFTELLTWVFLQEKDYSRALRQVRALDKKLGENGGRIFQLAQIAYNDQAYDAAIEAFDYIVNTKGPTSTFYLDAKRESLRANRDKLVKGYSYTKEELLKLEKNYETFVDEFGRSRITASMLMELAELEAYYLNNLDKAINILSAVIEYPNMNRYDLANAKLQLGDFYLMKNEVWESTLLYSQVDKEFKEDLLGHEARYKNANLSYFSGDFEWAQAQFKVLKGSTSKLIANDALDRSIFITDNLGLDTTAVPLQLYANAELLVFQNRFDEAFATMEELLKSFPNHGLQDDILYLQAQIYKKQRNYPAAANALQVIVDKHIEEIRGDNALFELATIYEYHLKDLEKAKELYETIFIDFSGSTFAVEARKRYRILRGDTIQ
jgi:tetratricopeptide (TPR) repeat protein